MAAFASIAVIAGFVGDFLGGHEDGSACSVDAGVIVAVKCGEAGRADYEHGIIINASVVLPWLTHAVEVIATDSYHDYCG